MKIVVLTGAGVSAESGLATFRDANGLWEGHDPMDVATPEAFADDPALVHRFYDERRAALGRVEPNAAHRALARLEEAVGENLFLVTQNVDDLHERGGSRRVHPMHGLLRSTWCTACDGRHDWADPLGHGPPCPACGAAALRPDVVWFGEMLPEDAVARASGAIIGADLLLNLDPAYAVDVTHADDDALRQVHPRLQVVGSLVVVLEAHPDSPRDVRRPGPASIGRVCLRTPPPRSRWASSSSTSTGM